MRFKDIARDDTHSISEPDLTFETHPLSDIFGLESAIKMCDNKLIKDIKKRRDHSIERIL
jgi:hypothetical protein